MEDVLKMDLGGGGRLSVLGGRLLTLKQIFIPGVSETESLILIKNGSMTSLFVLGEPMFERIRRKL